MPYKRKDIFFIIFSLVSCIAFSQQIPYINYNTHNGLPQIQVQELYQDSKGYIWVGTKGGLAKFNGENFETFLHKDYIRSMEETLEGEMYFTTFDSIYKQERGELISMRALKRRHSHIVTGENRFILYDGIDINEFRQDTLYNTLTVGVDIQEEITGIVFDRKKQCFLFSAGNSIYKIKHKEIIKEKTFHSGEHIIITSFPNGYVYYILKLSQDYFSYIDPATNNIFFKYRQDKSLDYRIIDLTVNKPPIKSFYLRSEKGRGVYVIDSLTNSARKIDFPFEEEVYPFMIDKDGNYWAGTDNGLYQLSSKNFRTYSSKYMNNCWSFIKGKDGFFYGGLYKMGLFRYDLKNVSQKRIKVKGINQIQETDFYYGASADANKNLYLPTHNGMVKYNYKVAKTFDTGISLISKYDIFDDKIVFGQKSGIGFIDTNEKIEMFIDNTQDIVGSHPAALDFKPNGDIWIGSYKGLAIFNKKTKTFESASSHYDIYPNDQVVSTAQDYKKNMWVGSKSGLWLYDSKKDKFSHIGQDFFKTKILSLISPDSTLLLIGTSYEIYAMRLDKFYQEDKVEFKMFNYRNGFFSQEIAQNGFYQDEDNIYIYLLLQRQVY